MSTLSESQQGFAEAARQVYEGRLKDQLEKEHFGEIVAIEPVSGECVVGGTLREVDRACRERFGDAPVHVFRVGGGGAVKIGGAWRGRIS